MVCVMAVRILVYVVSRGLAKRVHITVLRQNETLASWGLVAIVPTTIVI
jgi:hypothetical protein